MADMQGPKIRVGKFEHGKIELEKGAKFILDADWGVNGELGNQERVGLDYKALPRDLKPNDVLLLNDGLIVLIVDKVNGAEIHTHVKIGGELSNNKGINRQGGGLSAPALTAKDMEDIKTAMSFQADYVAVSFPKNATDMEMARQLANIAGEAYGHKPMMIAKIERAEAIPVLQEILDASDGIMVARGDLGVEVPIEEIAHTQKQLIAKANLAGQPVITATQMLESMVSRRLPTRAEATDVANAILDGTDCVMLSGESAMGNFPEESVMMLAKIAAFTETHRPRMSVAAQREFLQQPAATRRGDRMASVVEHALHTVPCDLLLVPTRGGSMARAISRFKPPVWIIAPSPDSAACQNLAFSYGVHPVYLAEEPDDWREWITHLARENELAAERVMLVAGPSPRNPKANYRIELMRLDAENLSAAESN